jgi:hypothetical protein
MRTWKSKRTVCRSRASGKFAGKRKCGMFKRTKVKVIAFGHLFGK